MPSVECSFKTLSLLVVFLLHQAIARANVPIIFNKPLDHESFKTTFNLTPSELIQYIRSQGVNVFLIQLNTNDVFHNSTLLAPSTLQKKWANNFSRNRILGKYFSANDLTLQIAQPTILITDENDKWTLLHEFMHYLFEKKRIELGIDDSTLYELQKNSREDFLDLSLKLQEGPALNQEILDQAIMTFSIFMNAEIKLAVLLTLEEIIIEKTISELFSQEKVLYLSDGQKRSAEFYINENYETISGQLTSYFAILDQLQKYLGNRSNPILDETSRRLDWFQSELYRLNPNAKITTDGLVPRNNQ